MEIEILNEKENPLLDRKEIKFRILYEGATPSIKEVRKKLISVLNSKDKLTVVDSIRSTFGGRVAGGYAKVYKDEESMKVEPKHRIKKNFGVEEKIGIEVKKGEVETLTEEKKEEKAVEEKVGKGAEKTVKEERPAGKKTEASSKKKEKSEVKKEKSGEK